MNEELLRCSKYSTFPSCPVTPIRLAQGGFVPTGNGDEVQCNKCQLKHSNWRTGDDPLQIHRQASPGCPFFNSRSDNELPSDSGDGINVHPNIEAPERIEGQPRYHLYSTYNQRISTFTTWPSSKSQKPEDMAGAGLFYTGIGDYVRCFHCGIGLKDWVTEDNPWHEHERWSTNCPLVKKIIGEAQLYGLSIPSHTQQEPPRSNTTETSPEHIPENDEELFKHSAVQSIQEMGYSDDFIRKACARLRSNKGKKVFCAVNLMKVIFTTEEEDEETQRINSETAKRCKVCFEGDLEMVLLPCGHLVVCATCAARLQTCPVCRANISGTVKVYMA